MKYQKAKLINQQGIFLLKSTEIIIDNTYANTLITEYAFDVTILHRKETDSIVIQDDQGNEYLLTKVN